MKNRTVTEQILEIFSHVCLLIFDFHSDFDYDADVLNSVNSNDDKNSPNEPVENEDLEESLVNEPKMIQMLVKLKLKKFEKVKELKIAEEKKDAISKEEEILMDLQEKLENELQKTKVKLSEIQTKKGKLMRMWNRWKNVSTISPKIFKKWRNIKRKRRI